MRERGRFSGRGGEAASRPREARSEPNRLSDESPPNVLTGTGVTKASGSPSWIPRRAARQGSSAAPAAQPATAEGRPATPATRNPPSWGTIIFAGFILFSLVRACLQ